LITGVRPGVTSPPEYRQQREVFPQAMDDPPPVSASASARRGGDDMPGSGRPLHRAVEDVAAQQGGENFPVALRLLPREPRGHLQSIYGYARFVDDLGDEAPGDRGALLDAVDAELDLIYAGRRPTLPVMVALAPTIAVCALPERPFRDLVAANRIDQKVDRYPTWDDLVAYCTLSANPVGALVLYVAGAATPAHLAASDRVCTALQVVEHLQDIAEDHRAGRIYLPQADMATYGVTEADLARPSAPPALRGLVAYETQRAEDMLAAGRGLVADLHGWARIAVAGYVGGGRAAVAGIRRAHFDTLRQAVSPGRPRTIIETLRLMSARTPGRRFA
jgi:squalene synthase HpnC